MGFGIVSDRDQVQDEIAAVGWDILYGNTITEFDAITFVISIPTGTTVEWFGDRIEAQLQQFAQSSTDISPEILEQAMLILEGIVQGKWLGKWDIAGLEIKAGVATYHRYWSMGICKWQVKKRMMDNYQPYIGVRVKQPLPAKEEAVTKVEVERVEVKA